MKPETPERPIDLLPDEELISPVDAPAEANDGPDGDALEDTDAPEDESDRAGEL